MTGAETNLLVGFDKDINGIAVVRRSRRTLSAELRENIQDGMTISEIVDILGPGWCSQYSGCGNIQWFFDDGVVIGTGLWPERPDKPLKLYETSWKLNSNKPVDSYFK